MDATSMEVIKLILLLSLFIHCTKAVDRPMVTLYPIWKTIFRTQSISLMCDQEKTGPKDQKFYWYKNNQLRYSNGHIFQISSAQMGDRGNYQCQYGEGPRSDVVKLDISNDWLILQANDVYEGDTLILQCQGWDSSGFGSNARFLKNKSFIYNGSPIYKKEKVSNQDSGRYSCERKRWWATYSDTADTFVTVHELFSKPVLKFVESLVIEGDHMTLKCDTNLDPKRKKTKLQFAFYKNGWNILQFSESNTYRVLSAQLEDSGVYTCEVRTAINTVRKNSNSLSIQVQAFFSEPELVSNQPKVFEGDNLTLKCNTILAPSKKNTELQFTFYKDGRILQEYLVSNIYRVQLAQLRDTGNYVCAVKTPNGAVKKKSKDSFIQIQATFGETQLKMSANEVVVGDNIVLSCESNLSLFPIFYTFYHNDTSFSNVTISEKKPAMITLSVNAHTTAGFYYCISDNGNPKQKQLSNMFNLLVIDSVAGVKIVLDKPGENFVPGDSLTLKCSIERGTSPSYLWLHNGRPVKEDSGVYQLRDHGRVLYIDPLRHHHTGSYQCEVRNKVSTNRTFSVISKIQNINILEENNGESRFLADDETTQQESVMWSLLGVLVLVVVLPVVLFFYRHKLGKIIPRFQKQTNPDTTFGKVRPRVGPIAAPNIPPTPDSTNNFQADYSNISNMTHPAEGEVCYSSIQINQMTGSTDHCSGQDEYSVIYSAVKCPETDMGRKDTMGHTELYENLMLAVRNLGKSERPTVTFSPNWRNIFVGEEISMTCNVQFGMEGTKKYSWYKNKNVIPGKNQKLRIGYAKPENQGNYQCRSGSGPLSSPVMLQIHFYEKLILQAPADIVEGDDLNLRCHSWPEYEDYTEANFYKFDINFTKSISEKHTLCIPNVKSSDNGKYKCIKEVQDGEWKEAETFILVEELFTSPKIKKTHYSVWEGNEMTLTCDTTITFLRPDTELRFAFYKYGQIVQEISVYDTYKVGTVQLENSGKYTCEVRTVNDTVRKKSNEISIQIQELFTSPQLSVKPSLPVHEGQTVTLKCTSVSKFYTSLFYVFYKDSQIIQRSDRNSYVISKAREENSGSYQCSVVQSWHGKVKKNSTNTLIIVQIAIGQPHLILRPSEVFLGNEIVVLCESLTGSLPISYGFYHRERLLGNITRHQKGAAKINLTFTSLTMAGPYTCQSSNDFSEENSDPAHLHVTEAVSGVRITVNKADTDFVFGENLMLNCSIEKGTSPSFLWMHNETVVAKDSDLYQIRDNGSVLYIESLQSHHAGTYKCKVSNKLLTSKPFSVVETFQIHQIFENPSHGSSIVWPVLGGLVLLLLLLSIILLIIKRSKLSSLFSSLNQRHNQHNSAPDKDKPGDEEKSTNELTNMPAEMDDDQHLYSNITTQAEENDVCYTYIDIRMRQGSVNEKDELSVVYAVIHPPGKSVPTQATPETDDSSNVYQNLNTKQH
ncbi:hemicentin-1-like [Pyxicephalus adspersus]|uniref:hemicentin-1-like n=1 Tax=Pyxicephalus adspersus TaxID=30357 RepID=UPI003B5A7897